MKSIKIRLLKYIVGISVVLSLAASANPNQIILEDCLAAKAPQTSKELSPHTLKAVGTANDLYSEKHVDQALAALYKIESEDEFDIAYVNRFIGILLAEEDEKKALEYLKAATNTKILSDKDHNETLRLIADLQLQLKLYEVAIDSYEAWMNASCILDAEALLRMAQAHYLNGDFEQAISLSDRASAIYEKPNEQTYILRILSYKALNMFGPVLIYTEALTQFVPESHKWAEGFTKKIISNLGSKKSKLDSLSTEPCNQHVYLSDGQLVSQGFCPAAKYPTKAARDGLEGAVVLSFKIQPDGTTSEIKNISSNPKNIFHRASIRAIKKWKFAPHDEEVEAYTIMKFRLTD